jgi:hypothetical protein
MNGYVDKYLREKLSCIITRQKEGKVVITAYKDDYLTEIRTDDQSSQHRGAWHPKAYSMRGMELLLQSPLFTMQLPNVRNS